LLEAQISQPAARLLLNFNYVMNGGKRNEGHARGRPWKVFDPLMASMTTAISVLKTTISVPSRAPWNPHLKSEILSKRRNEKEVALACRINMIRIDQNDKFFFSGT
jgi:hypothetical protein